MSTVPQTYGDVSRRDVGQAMLRGALGRCPQCSSGRLFHAYLKVADACPSCGEDLHHHQADDAPPYFTMLIVGHIVIALVLAVEVAYHPAIWIHLALWLPLTVILSLVLLPKVKGAVIGLQWANRMHGFDGSHPET